jgi:quercetin dioxygenase-like cupin family protein
MSTTNNLPPLRRFITTHDSEGHAIFSNIVPEENPSKLLPNGIAAFSLGYTTKSFPVDLNAEADISGYKSALESPPGLVLPGGTVLRFVDSPPGSISPMHRTVSLDYGVVIEGEVELVLDSGETRLMKRGDVAIQRATMHQWRNTSKTEWARMMYVLQSSKAVEVGGKVLEEDYGVGMEGVPKST